MSMDFELKLDGKTMSRFLYLKLGGNKYEIYY